MGHFFLGCPLPGQPTLIINGSKTLLLRVNCGHSFNVILFDEKLYRGRAWYRMNTNILLLRFFVRPACLLLISMFAVLGVAQAASESSTGPATRKPTAESRLTFQSLEQMDELVELGMPALALRLLKQEQQHVPVYTPDWYAIEQKHITLLAAVDNWQEVITRAEKVLSHAAPGTQITEQISEWFKSQQVFALLKLRQPEKALSKLRSLLWYREKPVTDSSLVAFWRRLIIRAYLLMDADEDAQKALLRYQQDYRDEAFTLNLEWRLLQARVLLRLHRPGEVVHLLADAKSPIAKALRLVAAIRVRTELSSLYTKDAEKELASKTISREETWAYRYVLYEAALWSRNPVKASVALRNLLALGHSYSALGEEFHVDGDDLWGLYEKSGGQTGNRLKLLIGDDLAWYNKAGELQKDDPEQAIGLYAVLAFSATKHEKRQLAHREIVNLLSKTEGGLEVINQLYLHSKKLSDIENLPLEVRYKLVDNALAKGDIELAAQLMKKLKQPPKGQDVFDWRMRTARVLILEGSYEQGEEILVVTLSENNQPELEQIDQYIQVVFDLQAVKRHKQALEMFELLKDEWLDDRLRMEINFWKAESSSALNLYEQSAWYYLKSALLADAAQNNLWARSARFKAANALTQAQLYDDAQKIYLELLRFAATASEKTVLKQELQQIQLLRNAEKRGQSEKS